MVFRAFASRTRFACTFSAVFVKYFIVQSILVTTGRLSFLAASDRTLFELGRLMLHLQSIVLLIELADSLTVGFLLRVKLVDLGIFGL